LLKKEGLTLLDKISPNYSVNFIPKSAFRAAYKQPVTNPTVQNASLQGTDALAAYNSAFINRQNDFFDIPVVKPVDIPDDINQIKGEKIYNSKGELVQIVDEDDKYKKIYEQQDGGYYYRIFDKTDKNRKVFEQVLKNNYLWISQYDKNRNTSYITHFEDGKIIQKSRLQEFEDGSNKALEYDYETQKYEYMGYDAKLKTSTDTFYDKNKKVISKRLSKWNGNSQNITNYNYDKGELYSKEEKIIKSCSDSALKYPLDDPDLTPVKVPDYELDLDKVQGKRTYYSNGELESIKTPTGLKYNISENVITIVDRNKTTTIDLKPEVHLKKWMQAVEDLGNGVYKTTFYITDKNGDENINTTHTKGDFNKSLCKTNGKISMYDEMKACKQLLRIDYDDNGNVLKKTEGDAI